MIWVGFKVFVAFVRSRAERNYRLRRERTRRESTLGIFSSLPTSKIQWLVFAEISGILQNF